MTKAERNLLTKLAATVAGMLMGFEANGPAITILQALKAVNDEEAKEGA